MDSIQARLLSNSRAGPTEGEEMLMGPPTPPQLGPPGADSEDWGGVGWGEAVRQGAAEDPGRREDPSRRGADGGGTDV